MAMVHPDDLAAVHEWGHRAVVDRAPFDHRYRVIDADGVERWVHVRGAPEVEDDGTVIMLGTMTDVTEVHLAQRRLAAARDAARQAERARGELVSLMSHEIRTPLNTVLGTARRALRGPLSDEQREQLERIVLAAGSVAAMVNDVMELVHADRVPESERHPFAVSSLASMVTAATGARADERGIALEIEVADRVPSHLHGDVQRIGQVIINLVSNAIRFTDRGRVRVAIDLEAGVAGADPVLRIAVHDTGVGFDAAQAERIFEPFAQAHSDPRRSHGGSGLGLTICQRIVELLGGRIWAESRPGTGSTFTFTARVARVQDSAGGRAIRPRVQVAAVQPGGGDPGSGPRVLVVDDDRLNRELMADLLEEVGLRVSTAKDAADALAILAVQRFGLVLMDRQMPGMDGLEATRRIREDPAQAGVEVVVVSAQTRPEDHRASVAAGARAHLDKPVDEVVLRAVIERLLGPRAEWPSDGAVGRLGDPAQPADGSDIT